MSGLPVSVEARFLYDDMLRHPDAWYSPDIGTLILREAGYRAFVETVIQELTAAGVIAASVREGVWFYRAKSVWEIVKDCL